MNVTIEKQKDGSYIAYNTDGASTIIGTGASVSEAKADFMATAAETSEICKKNGVKVPETATLKPVFKFDLASLFEYYSFLNVSAFARYVGVNPTLMRQYKQGNTYISEKQVQKIETSLHRIGQELSAIRLV